MPDKGQFDILIIGSGEAGKYLAWTMAKDGRRTAVVERGLIGGAWVRPKARDRIVAMFRDKFWLTFALTIPTVIWCLLWNESYDFLLTGTAPGSSGVGLHRCGSMKVFAYKK
jgi:choline dehydrogenase-like flavoprotein